MLEQLNDERREIYGADVNAIPANLVKGNAGAYIFVVDAINGEVDPATIDTERTPDMTQRESEMGRAAVDVLTSKADIKDFRGEGEI